MSLIKSNKFDKNEHCKLLLHNTFVTSPTLHFIALANLRSLSNELSLPFSSIQHSIIV